jgi:hypothetical protein
VQEKLARPPPKDEPPKSKPHAIPREKKPTPKVAAKGTQVLVGPFPHPIAAAAVRGVVSRFGRVRSLDVNEREYTAVVTFQNKNGAEKACAVMQNGDPRFHKFKITQYPPEDNVRVDYVTEPPAVVTPAETRSSHPEAGGQGDGMDVVDVVDVPGSDDFENLEEDETAPSRELTDEVVALVSIAPEEPASPGGDGEALEFSDSNNEEAASE